MFRAVLESWVRMWGWVCGRIVLPIVVARSSAVFTLDVPVPMNWGTYVTRARRGIVGLCCQDEVVSNGSEEQSMTHKTAAAVIMGVVLFLVGGVYPPSTAIIRGDL